MANVNRFPDLSPGQRQLSAVQENRLRRAVEGLGQMEPAAGLVSVDGMALDPNEDGYFLAKITGVTLVSPGGIPAYAWTLLAEAGDIVNQSFQPINDPGGMAGVVGNFPAFELSGNPSVPVDGSAVVRLWPGQGGQYLLFEWQGVAGGGAGETEIRNGFRINFSYIADLIPTGPTPTNLYFPPPDYFPLPNSWVYDTITPGGGKPAFSVMKFVGGPPFRWTFGANLIWDPNAAGVRALYVGLYNYTSQLIAGLYGVTQNAVVGGYNTLQCVTGTWEMIAGLSTGFVGLCLFAFQTSGGDLNIGASSGEVDFIGGAFWAAPVVEQYLAPGGTPPVIKTEAGYMLTNETSLNVVTG